MDNEELIETLRYCFKSRKMVGGVPLHVWCDRAADALEADEKRIARLEEDLKTREAEREIMQDTIKICEEAADRYKAQLPKEGEWIPVTNGRGGHECSLCHGYAPTYQNGDEHLSDYCPSCGARMKDHADAN